MESYADSAATTVEDAYADENEDVVRVWADSNVAP